jgi:fibro-slime domain-containing protein
MGLHSLAPSDQRGSVLMVAVIIILAMGVLGLSMVTTSRMQKTMAANYASHLQSFYAADGQMTLLGEETIDGKFFKYVVADSAGGLINLAMNRPCGDWGENDGSHYPAAALDDDLTTFWRSNSDDNQCGIYLDFSSPVNVNRVAVTWTDEFAQSYVFFTWNGSGWTQLNPSAVTGGENSRIVTTFSPQTISSLCIWCFGWRSGKNAYGIKEMEAYAVSDSGGPGIDTVTLGRFNVIWKMDKTAAHSFTLQTEAYRPNGTITNTYKTPLKQKLTIAAVDLVNPFGPVVNAPVMYYDFHSNRTNPEFEIPHMAGAARKNMVATTLDSDHKPTVGSSPFFNYFVYYWFRPSSDFAATAKVRQYPSTPAFQECFPGGDLEWSTAISAPKPNTPANQIAANVAFANVAIQAVLPFTHIGNGVYELDDPMFFPLDGQGFCGGGPEWNFHFNCYGTPDAQGRNYGFTMEMHRTFVKAPGQKFIFRGDDDVWLFINNKLVMDLGGMHMALSDTVLIDTMSTLLYNHTYNFDFFYCERHSNQSSIRITTNMLVALTTSENRSWRRDYGNLD